MTPDLNLLHTLDVLLAEGSVVRAARKLELSPSAMSRALARLREATGDQLLVRAGRGLVPTPRAQEMREKVRLLVEDGHALLRPTRDLDLVNLARRFTIRASDGLAETIGPELIRRVRHEAPRVQLRFTRKLDKDSQGLRDGSVDLETGVVDGAIGPEVRAKALFVDGYVGVVSPAHPLASHPVSSADFVAWPHVVVSRPGLDLGDIDQRLAQLGLSRTIMTSVDGFSAALALARGTDLVAIVPEKHTLGLRDGLRTFTIPLALRTFTISLLWHPRLDGDPAHRWLRELMDRACRQLIGQSREGS